MNSLSFKKSEITINGVSIGMTNDIGIEHDKESCGDIDDCISDISGTMTFTLSKKDKRRLNRFTRKMERKISREPSDITVMFNCGDSNE